MQYRKLGKSGPQVSALGMGCMRLPVIGGDPEKIDEPSAERLIHGAIERGITYLDTAYPYHGGTSEPFLGRTLQGGLRDKVQLATKLPPWLVETEADFDRLFGEQLERLRTDRVDFYLLHALKADWWKKLYELGVLDFLSRSLSEGRIGHVGFSFHDELKAFRPIVDAFDWTFCQIQYNYMDDNHQAGTEGLRYASEKGLGVVVMEPLRGGHLARHAAGEVEALWSQTGRKGSPAEWALRWVWDHPEVAVALSGMNDLEQLEENCRIAETALPSTLTAQELSVIGKVRDHHRRRIKVPCTACGYCMPCPAGVNIPKIFAIYNDVHIYGDRGFPHRIYTVSMNASEAASRCTACGQCEAACPQGIAVIESLKQAHRILAEPPEEQ